MEQIEKAIYDMEKNSTDFLDAHKNKLSKLIYNTANNSINSSNGLDTALSRYFPQIKEMENSREKSVVINPKLAIEFENGKARTIYSGWDKEKGILPEIKFMGKYMIDVGIIFDVNKTIHNCFVMCNSCKLALTVNDIKCDYGCDGCNGRNLNIQNWTCNTHKHMGHCGGRNTNCTGCNRMKCIHCTTSGNFTSFSNIEYYKRHTEITPMFINRTITFEVDNYLNLYHKESGLYLLFNKLSFPLFPFYNKQEIFKAKSKDKLDFVFEKDKYKLKDMADEFIEKSNELIPDDYNNVFEYFNNFRKLPEYNSKQIEKMEINMSEPKDIIIRELQTKLANLMEKQNVMNEMVNQMTSDYKEHSYKIIELQDTLTKKNIMINSIKEEYESKTCEQVEKLKIEIFTRDKMLLEKETIVSQINATQKELSENKILLEELQTSNKKLRNINNGLLDTIKNQKTSCDDLKEQNLFLTKQCNELNAENTKLSGSGDELIEELNVLNNKYNDLQEKLKLVGEKSNNVLELALNDRIAELETVNKDLTEKLNILKNDNKTLESKLSKITKMFENFNSI